MTLGRLCSILTLLTLPLPAQDPTMVRGLSWRTDTVVTAGHGVGGYVPIGILDGLGALPAATAGRITVLANHEVGPGVGYPYQLANGTSLTGARISSFEVGRVDGRGVPYSAGIAYDRIYDRSGALVTDPAQINETGSATDGLSRLCSARMVRAGTYGFVDDIYFTGEEAKVPSHPQGGTIFALDVARRDLWAAPELGRGAWENACPVDTGNPKTVALLLGCDNAAAPLYLFVGTKGALGNGSFLDRNGLAVGQLYAWKADNGDTTPQQFNTEGSQRTGTFVPLTVQNPAFAGQSGYDPAGYLNNETLQNQAAAAGCFQFSRPEDLHTDPADGSRVVFASCGHAPLFPADNWGMVYIVRMSFGGENPNALVRVIHDADNRPVPDNNIRNPDNVTWADNGFIYVQEDQAVEPPALFGAVSGIDASIW